MHSAFPFLFRAGLRGGRLSRPFVNLALCRRIWHKEHKLWLAQVPGVEPSVKTERFERGSYLMFDASTWDRVRKDNFVLQYDVLLEGPQRGPLRRE